LVLPFGLKAIDRHLPEGGLALGALHEVAGGGHGAIDGAAAALFAAGIAARTRGKDLFAPALAQAGLMPDRVIYVEAGDEKSVLICFEEGLRHGGLGAVVAEVARLSTTASVTRWRISALPRNPLAGAWRWTPPVAARIDPVPRWGKRRFRSGGLRCQGSSRSFFQLGPRTR
jgi:protein ImuA